MNQENNYGKLDVYSISYTTSPSNYKYVVGKSIKTNEERYITCVNLNPEDQGYNEFITFCINDAKSINSRTIALDYRLIDKKVVEILKDAYKKGNITGIRIIPDKTLVTKDIIEQFSDKAFNGFLITGDKIEIPTNSHLDIRETNDLCKIERTKVKFENSNDEYDEYNIHITRKLTREEITEFAKILNKNSYTTIVIDFYEPMYYEFLLEALKEENINKDVYIKFLANPLYDEAEIYQGLDEIIENPIIIEYNTCNDLNEYHRTEPFTICSRYYSDIEASGRTTVSNYESMIKMFDEVINELENKDYSPLEKVAYIHDYFKNNYHYNYDYALEDGLANRDLDRVYSKDKMICEGFSNLYSALLRRAGIMCFTYGTDIHQKNIIRITDEKYGIDNIAIIDPTWDLDNFVNRNVFKHFLVPIDNDLYAIDSEVINIPTSLTITNGLYSTYISESNPVYATDPLGYAIRMLELMGLTSGEKTFDSLDEEARFYKSALANSGLTERIPDEKIIEAIKHVRQTENNYPIEEEYDNSEMARNVTERGNAHNFSPRIRLFDNSEVETRSHIPEQDVSFTVVEDQNARYHRPRKINTNETKEEYQEYLRRFYHETFYLNELEQKEDIVESIEYIPREEPSKEPLEEYFVVEKIRIFRDTTNPHRLFAPISVFQRFHVELPDTHIMVPKRENIYELNKMFAYLILNNNENSYAPYDIEFENIDVNSLEAISKKIEIGEEEDLIPGTNFKKPRGRKIYETDDEYVEYLEYYYNSIFPPEEETSKSNIDQIDVVPRPRGTYETDEEYTRYLQDFYGTVPEEDLIPGTKYRKPRARGNYETDEEYVEFLEKYYTEIFGEEVVEKSKRR